MLAWFSGWSGSYVIALLFYALIFKIVFLPFTIKQQRNQIAMAKLQPKIELIRAKYKGRTDRVSMQKQQQEIMELQQKEGYSALAGCLPLLIQLPLIIILYNVIRKPLSFLAKFSEEAIININTFLNGSAQEFKAIDQISLISKIQEEYTTNGLGAGLENAGLTMELYESIPNLNLWGMNLGLTPSLINFSLLVIVPVIAAASQWFTMWVTKKINGNPQAAVAQPDSQTQMSMRIMDLVFPLMTLWMAFNFSAMLGVYWIIQSVLAILQTLIISRAMPMPKYTEEEIKAMRKAQRQAEKNQREILKTQPKFKSLHYIDDDDYEELPDVKVKENTTQKPKSSDIPEIKD